MTAGRTRSGFLLTIVAGLLAACTSVTPTLRPTPLPSIASASPAAVGVPVSVRFAGKINCATFPYSCSGILSVLEPGVAVDETWRPPASDVRWLPRSGGYDKDTDHLDPTAVGAVPTLAVGTHQVVISLLGSSDAISFAPDGTIATDLLSRCSADVDVTPSTSQVSILVTFTPDGQTYGGTCTVKVEP